jgi:hypothetical protein
MTDLFPPYDCQAMNGWIGRWFQYQALTDGLEVIEPDGDIDE